MPNEPRTKPRKGVEEITLDADEEAALDAAWASLDGYPQRHQASGTLLETVLRQNGIGVHPMTRDDFATRRYASASDAEAAGALQRPAHGPLVDSEAERQLLEDMGGTIEALPGGLGDRKGLDAFDPAEVAMGMEVEREHSPDEQVRREIVADHLSEDPQYYTHLKAAEKNRRKYAGVPDDLPDEEVEAKTIEFLKGLGYSDEQIAEAIEELRAENP